MIPSNAGIAKFNSHIKEVTITTVSGFTDTKLNIHNETDPFMAQSNKAKLGIMDAMKYIKKIKLRAVK